MSSTEQQEATENDLMTNAAFPFQIWICSIWLLQEIRRPWAQTLALCWDVFRVQKGETHLHYEIYIADTDNSFECFDTILSHLISQGIHNFDTECFQKYGKVWG